MDCSLFTIFSWFWWGTRHVGEVVIQRLKPWFGVLHGRTRHMQLSTQPINNMRPLIFVHGFRYDPSKSGEDNPHETIYKEWREHFPDREIVEFSYYSGGSGFEAVARAWAAGYRNSYRWAYGKLALDAAKRLIEEANALGECDVVCHSLGSRVVLEAANKGAPFKRSLSCY